MIPGDAASPKTDARIETQKKNRRRPLETATDAFFEAQGGDRRYESSYGGEKCNFTDFH